MKKNWQEKQLLDVSDKIFAGGDKPKEFSKYKNEKHYIPIYANGEKNKGLYGYTDVSKVNTPSITISARGTIGYSEIRKMPFFPIVRLIVLIPNKNIIDIDFLHYGIKNTDFSNTGTSIPQLTVPMVKKYKIPLPPLPEQKRIVSILDRCFLAIDQAKSNAEKNLKNAKEIFVSYLQQVFENKGKDWEEKNLKEITKKIGSGATPRGGKESYKKEDSKSRKGHQEEDHY